MLDFSHEMFMQRCLQLAALGKGFVAPNPLVGAVLVHQGRIIGEGFHQVFGGPHAEVNCVNSVAEADRHLIPESTLYVSLEPCAHHGKTPPCADFIIRQGIPFVVVGCPDPFAQVNGAGVAKLEAAGVPVQVGVLRNDCLRLNKHFFHFQQTGKPWVTLKWAATANNKTGLTHERLRISSHTAAVLTHRLRAAHQAILVGYRTILVDDPLLDLRFANGCAPIILLLDRQNKLSRTARIFQQGRRVVVFTEKPSTEDQNIQFVQLNFQQNLPDQILAWCAQSRIQSVFVEGGARTHQFFMDAHCWQEAVVYQSRAMAPLPAVAAPNFEGHLLHQFLLENDLVSVFSPRSISLP